MEDEENQKSVIRDYLKKTGYTDTQISKKLERFEDAGLLEDEANDDLDLLKKYNELEKEQALNNLKEAKAQQVKQQQEFYDGITDGINNLKSIKNVKIPKDDRSKLMQYLFKTDNSGMTQYLKDWLKDTKKSLIESAYFMMKGDDLLKSASRSGETSAVKKLKQSFKTSKGNKSQSTVSSKQPTPVFKFALMLTGNA